MAARGRGGGARGRGRGMPAFMSKETKELLSIHGIGRVDNVPPPVYDVSLMPSAWNWHIR
jgi:hypothetical protein